MATGDKITGPKKIWLVVAGIMYELWTNVMDKKSDIFRRFPHTFLLRFVHNSSLIPATAQTVFFVYAFLLGFVRNLSVIPATAVFFFYLFFCFQSPFAETINLVRFVRNLSVIPATAQTVFFLYLFFCHQSSCTETINCVPITFRSDIGRFF